MAAFIFGALLALTGIIAAIVQFAISRRRPRLAAHLPLVLRGSLGCVAVGVFFAAAAEFRWIDGSVLDDWSLPVMFASLVTLVVTHVMWVRRGRGSEQTRPPDAPAPGN
jgi:hypothetical protein